MSSPWRADLEQRQSDLKRNDGWRSRRAFNTAQKPISYCDDQPIINFCSNDYLGLANHPQLIDVAQESAREWGVGSGASHLVCGHQTPHHQLEMRIAEFVGAERALLFSTGYMANLAICTTFARQGDLLLQDKLNHASLVDGARLADASCKRYAHSNMSHAERLLGSSEYEKAVLITDGVFSMDGDIAQLSDLKYLADSHKALLVVDDAHGLACVGATGRGSLEVAGLVPTDNILLMGTFGKAFGSFGAFVAGDRLFIEQLIQSARTYIYTTALPPGVAATSRASIDIVEADGRALRDSLNARIAQFRLGMRSLSLPVSQSTSPIQPLIVGESGSALRFSESLLQQGFLVSAIRPPTVRAGSARLRFTFSASHTQAQVSELLRVIANLKVDNGTA